MERQAQIKMTVNTAVNVKHELLQARHIPRYILTLALVGLVGLETGFATATFALMMMLSFEVAWTLHKMHLEIAKQVEKMYEAQYKAAEEFHKKMGKNFETYMKLRSKHEFPDADIPGIQDDFDDLFSEFGDDEGDIPV